MGMVREDLLFDMARHVDSTVHQFEEWGLPLMRNPKTGAYQREGRWQIMIHGESYKPIVAEAAKKSADKVFNRVCVTHLLMDESKENRVAGAVGLQRAYRQLPRVQVQDRDRRCRRCVQHLQAALRR
jgi:adenylylsulfate reductase, subunit A